MAQRRGEKQARGRKKKDDVKQEDALRALASIALSEASKETKIDLEDDKERAYAIDGILARGGGAALTLFADLAVAELEDLADAGDADDDDDDDDSDDD